MVVYTPEIRTYLNVDNSYACGPINIAKWQPLKSGHISDQDNVSSGGVRIRGVLQALHTTTFCACAMVQLMTKSKVKSYVVMEIALFGSVVNTF